MKDMKPIPIEKTIGQPLSSVEFVQDYVQLRFDGPTLTAFTWPILHVEGTMIRFNEPGYRDRLCERIGHRVLAAAFREAEALSVKFDDEVEMSISLRPEDRQGPEAGYFTLSSDPGEPLLDF